jgi:2'-5' RNA ligase
MSERGRSGTADTVNAGELESFRRTRLLRNHWSRPPGPRSYYWYLTFEQSPGLHSLVAECQRAISFPYYDPVPVHDLHLTLDRIAFEGQVTRAQLDRIEIAARKSCEKVPPFDITIGRLSGTPGAVGFTAFPNGPISDLRSTLRGATLSAYPEAPVRDVPFHPHLTIAYSNSDDVPANEVISIVERLNATARVDVTILRSALVLLERDQHSYAWHTVSRIPLRQGR